MLKLTTTFFLSLTLAAFAAAPPAPAAAQTRLTNANTKTVAASGNLTAQFKAIVDQQVEPAWIAYTQPIVDGTLSSCCIGWSDNGAGQTCCVACPLEGGSNVMSITEHAGDDVTGRGPGQPIKLEGATDFVLLFRIEQRRIDRVRVYSADCALDAGGRTVHALTGVRAADSLALLESLTTTWTELSTNRRSVPDSLVTAIAYHRDPAADGVLKKLIAPTQTDDVRRRAAYWLARARGRAGFETVRGLMNDESERMRKDAVHAVSMSREPEVTTVLIAAARSHARADVRGEALFWLAQRASKQAAATITSAIENDPETEVKVRAVTALSRLPKEEGVPLLINVAKTNKNPAVRKRAMSQLGQSKDPRAIDFFESVLK